MKELFIFVGFILINAAMKRASDPYEFADEIYNPPIKRERTRRNLQFLQSLQQYEGKLELIFYAVIVALIKYGMDIKDFVSSTCLSVYLTVHRSML